MLRQSLTRALVSSSVQPSFPSAATAVRRIATMRPTMASNTKPIMLGATFTSSFVRPMSSVMTPSASKLKLPSSSRIISPLIPSSASLHPPSSFSSSISLHSSPHRFIAGRSREPERVQERTRVEEQQQQQQQQVRVRPPTMAQPPVMSQPTSSVYSQNSTTGRSPTTPTMSTAEVVLKNEGLAEFLGRTYRTTGLSVCASLGLSYGLGALGYLSAMTPGFVLIGGAVMSIGSLLGLMFNRPKTLRRPEAPEKLYTVNSLGRQLMYGTFIAGNALLMAPQIAIVSAINPLIVPAAVAASALTMGGASYYAYLKPNGSLLSLAAPLTGALVGMIGLQLASFATFYFMGANAFTAAVSTVYPYVGIGVFAALTGLDTHKAIEEYQNGEADHLNHAVSFYLNAINLISYFMRIFSRD